MNEYLGYLSGRNYSPGHGPHLWVLGGSRSGEGSLGRGVTVDGVATMDVFEFLVVCRQERVRGCPGPNVLDVNANRRDWLAPASINVGWWRCSAYTST